MIIATAVVAVGCRTPDARTLRRIVRVLLFRSLLLQELGKRPRVIAAHAVQMLGKDRVHALARRNVGAMKIAYRHVDKHADHEEAQHAERNLVEPPEARLVIAGWHVL